MLSKQGLNYISKQQHNIQQRIPGKINQAKSFTGLQNFNQTSSKWNFQSNNNRQKMGGTSSNFYHPKQNYFKGTKRNIKSTHKLSCFPMNQND